MKNFHLQVSRSVKFLGIIFNNNLNVNNHRLYICNKMSNFGGNFKQTQTSATRTASAYIIQLSYSPIYFPAKFAGLSVKYIFFAFKFDDFGTTVLICFSNSLC